MLLEQAEHLHRQFFQLGTSRAGTPAWEPPVDIVETEQALDVSVALPGVRPDDIEIRIDAGALLVVARRRIRRSSQSAVIHRLEIPHGRFVRRIELPRGRFELRREELTNGCLQLYLQKLS